MSGVGPRNHLRISKTRISRQLLRPATVPNKPEIELLEAERRLLTFAESYDKAPETATLNAIWERARETAKSASGSWLGYHANMLTRTFGRLPLASTSMLIAVCSFRRCLGTAESLSFVGSLGYESMLRRA